MLYYSHFTEEETEALRGPTTHPRPHPREVELGCQPSWISTPLPQTLLRDHWATGSVTSLVGEEGYLQAEGRKPWRKEGMP